MFTAEELLMWGSGSRRKQGLSHRCNFLSSLYPYLTQGHRWQVHPASFLPTALCPDFWFFPVQAAQGSIMLIQQTLQQPHLQGPRMNSSISKGISLVSAPYSHPIISTHPRSNTSFGPQMGLCALQQHIWYTLAEQRSCHTCPAQMSLLLQVMSNSLQISHFTVTHASHTTLMFSVLLSYTRGSKINKRVPNLTLSASLLT